MKEIKLTIPEGCKTVTIKMDGEQVITEFEPKEEKWTPKDGDILYGKSITENIIIYKGTNEHGAVLSYAGIVSFLGVDRLFICQNLYTGFGHTIDYTRYATEEEKQRLFDALAKEGKRWNAEKKQIEDLPRWRAKEEKTYYYIAVDAEVKDDLESGCIVNDACYSVGNYFKTREAAEKVAEQIREIFKNSKAE